MSKDKKSKAPKQAIGVDIGGTGIKAALVDVRSGELLSDRIKLPTPDGGEPEAIAQVVVELVGRLDDERTTPVGVTFPAIVRHGRTLSAANVSKRWIDFEAEAFFEQHLGRPIHFVNDADAAGIAEDHWGAAKDVDGLVILTTLGTGIGGALIYKGVLVPNAELGHLELDGHDAESRASNRARESEGLSYEEWATRLQRYYAHLEFIFSPDLFVVGGGVSKSSDKFLPLLDLKTPIVPATLRNNAGIMGAAALAVGL
ncbi:polyphosphate--glucose phosphotransferase [Agrococcus sp. SGAir0287]|uniref:polyphosphate--glucose phosphotransferase n=1 Tax=Agrococcus sp. SGAir0287 TaxID=2070347 RepID=UPI0010CD466C|nr:ROK family protein [Agrococcus sp. SGAir0287]QCR19390.1 polyphosphate glucokinase [Agrococcus sp. SGAir0287]